MKKLLTASIMSMVLATSFASAAQNNQEQNNGYSGAQVAAISGVAVLGTLAAVGVGAVVIVHNVLLSLRW